MPASVEPRVCPICGRRLFDRVCKLDGVETIDERLLSGELAFIPPGEGSLLAGRYRLGPRLGAGAHGAVHAAEQLSIKRDVALKLLHQDRLRSDGFRRFYREARAASGLTSPHIVKVFDFGVDGETGTPFIAMERLAGRSLDSLIESEAPLQEDRALRLVRQVALALEAAHEASVVHRDLKPRNVMVSGSTVGEHATVVDFGIARLLDADPLTATRDVVGTPLYMSPEQAENGPVTPLVDLYALGCILHELLTGRPPFSAESPIQVMYMHVRDPVPVLEGSSAGSQALQSRLLAKEPQDRPASARQLVGLIDEVLAGSPLSPLPKQGVSTQTAEALPLIGSVPTSELARPDGPSPTPEAPPLGESPSHHGSSLEGHPEPRRSRPRWRKIPVLAWLGCLVALVGVGSITSIRARPSAPLLKPGAMIVCPPLRGEGWLGAAVATRVCGRIVTMMGGGPDREVIAAELLDIPLAPTESAPEDPFSDPEARERAVKRALSLGQVWLDGEVDVVGASLHTKVFLRNVEGEALAQAEATGALHEVEQKIVMAFVDQGQIPAAAHFSSADARWLGIQTSSTALAHFDVYLGLLESRYSAELCERVLRAEDVAPFRRKMGRSLCLGEGLALDRSSLPALAWTTPWSQIAPADAQVLAAELREARLEAADREARVRLGVAEAAAWLQAGQLGRAREGALAAVLAEPEDLGARTVLGHTSVGGGRGEVVWANINGWRPDFGNWWVAFATEHPPGSDQALRYLRRAHVLSPFNASASADLTVALLRRGEVEEGRQVAVRLSLGPEEVRLASEVTMLLVEAREGRLAEAERRADALLGRMEYFGVIEQQDIYLVSFISDLAEFTPRGRLLAARFAKRFVLDASPRMTAGSAYSLEGAMVGCLPALDLRLQCAQRLRGLLARGYFSSVNPTSKRIFEGLAALAEGRYEAAVEKLRPLAHPDSVRALWLYGSVMASALEEAGATELAEVVDQALIGNGGLYAGVGPEHLRAAQRAGARGEAAQAGALAAQVVDALGSSDRALPAVEALRSFLR